MGTNLKWAPIVGVSRVAKAPVTIWQGFGPLFDIPLQSPSQRENFKAHSVVVKTDLILYFCAVRTQIDRIRLLVSVHHFLSPQIRSLALGNQCVESGDDSQ